MLSNKTVNYYKVNFITTYKNREHGGFPTFQSLLLSFYFVEFDTFYFLEMLLLAFNSDFSILWYSVLMVSLGCNKKSGILSRAISDNIFWSLPELPNERNVNEAERRQYETILKFLTYQS